jgi:hypothetical protein
MTHRVLRSSVGMIRQYDFVMPSALQGAGTVMDIAGTAELSNYRLHATPDLSDAKAFHGDWRAVGRHLRRAVGREGERLTKP